MKKTIITVFALMVIFGFAVSGAMAQATWTWSDPISVTNAVVEITGDPNSETIYGIDGSGFVGPIVTGGTVSGTALTGAPPIEVAKDLVVGFMGLVYTIDDKYVGVLNSEPNPLADQQPKTPTDKTGTYGHIAAGNNGKLYVLFQVNDTEQYLLIGNPPLITVTAEVKISPQSLNLGSKGNWVTCNIRLPNEYKAKDVDISTVCITAINGNPLEELEYICPADGAPYNVGEKLMVKFSRSALADALSAVASPVTLTVTGSGENEAGVFTFAGLDEIKTKPAKLPKEKKGKKK